MVLYHFGNLQNIIVVIVHKKRKRKCLFSQGSILGFFVIPNHLCSLLNYCYIVYYPCLDRVPQDQVQHIKNNCCRFIFNSQHIGQLKWLKLPYLLQQSILAFLFRLIKAHVQLIYLKNKCSKMVFIIITSDTHTLTTFQLFSRAILHISLLNYLTYLNQIYY